MSSNTQRFDDLPDETKDFLTSLSREDVSTLQTGLPIIRAIVGFGKVTKWLAIGVLSLLAGLVMLGESVGKIIAWMRPPA